MTGFEYAPPTDPNIVFTPGYWGESHRPFNGNGYLAPSVPPGELQRAEEETSELFLDALLGDIEGEEVPKDLVLDPSDPEQSAHSAINFRSAILLGVAERLTPKDPKSPPQDYSVQQDIVRLNHLDTDPADMILTTMSPGACGGMVYRAARLAYDNGELEYRKEVTFLYVGARRGAAALLRLEAFHPHINSDGSREPVADFADGPGIWQPGVVGRSHVKYRRRRGADDFVSAHRTSFLKQFKPGDPRGPGSGLAVPRLRFKPS